MQCRAAAPRRPADDEKAANHDDRGRIRPRTSRFAAFLAATGAAPASTALAAPASTALAAPPQRQTAAGRTLSQLAARDVAERVLMNVADLSLGGLTQI
jgi:hypothetical protein